MSHDQHVQHFCKQIKAEGLYIAVQSTCMRKFCPALYTFCLQTMV